MSAADECRIGYEITRDIEKWTHENVVEIDKSAKKIQGQMKKKLEETSPVRDYPYNGGTVMQIVVCRRKNVKAIKKPAEHQPGTFKRTGWQNVTLNKKYKNYNTRVTYAVRKKEFPSIVHLLNSDHDVKAHGEKTGYVVHGSGFVDDVEKWGQKELDKKIKEVFNK